MNEQTRTPEPDATDDVEGRKPSSPVVESGEADDVEGHGRVSIS